MVINIRKVLYVAIALSAFIFTPEPPTLNIIKTDNPPKIDGVLSEQCWKDAEIIKDFFLDTKNQKSKVITKAYITFDNKNLYIAINAYDSDLSEVKADTQKFDQMSVFSDDSIEIFIAPEPIPKRSVCLFLL